MKCLRCDRDLTKAAFLIGDPESVKRLHDSVHILEIQEVAAKVINKSRELAAEVKADNWRCRVTHTKTASELEALIAEYDESITRYDQGWED